MLAVSEEVGNVKVVERGGVFRDAGDAAMAMGALRGMMIFAGLDLTFVFGRGVVGGIIFVSVSEGAAFRYAACMGIVITSCGGIQKSAEMMLQLDEDSKEDTDDEAECVKMRPSRRRRFIRGRGPPPAVVGDLAPMGRRRVNVCAVEGVGSSCGHMKL
jgi:hypothetical protein